MAKYTAKITQTEDSIHALTEMQFNVYQKKLKYGLIAASIAMTVAGVLLYELNKAALALAFIGCILFTNINVYPRYIAGRVIKACEGKFPTLVYLFEDKGLKVGEDGMSTGYKSVCYMNEDDRYLYIFFNSRFCYLIEKTKVLGENGYSGLKAFLEKKTGIPVKKYSKYLIFDLKAFLAGREKAGPRL